MSKTTERSVRAPMPPFIPPSLATLAAEPPVGAQWAHEIKFDGYRLQARIEKGSVRLLTRSGLNWTEKFGALAEALLALKVSTAIIDGEVVVETDHGVSSFSDLVADLKAKRAERMIFYAFDLMYLNGKDLRASALVDRKAQLNRLIGNRKRDSQIKFSDHVQGHGDAMLAEACKLGLEGIISKRLDKPYRSGRGNDWLKAKCILSDEFVVVGYVNSNAVGNAIGALVVGFYDGARLVYAGRVGTGFNRRMASELWLQLEKTRLATSPLAQAVDAVQAKGVTWVNPRFVAQVAYGDWTADGLLRHASFKALRTDKPPRKVTDPRK